MMTTCSYPDEFSAGHMGRIRMLNGFESNAITAERLSQYLEIDSQCNALATISGLEHIEYMQKHTLMPLRYPFGRLYRGNEEIGRYCHHFAHPPKDNDSIRVIRCCNACLQDQTNMIGFSYWIRQHQIPGLTACYLHKQPLLKIAVKNAFERSPDYYFTSRDRTWKEERTYGDHAYIFRYSDIAISLLSMKQPLQPPAYSIGEEYLNTDGKYCYSELRKVFRGWKRILLHSYPRTWLREHFFDNRRIFMAQRKHEPRRTVLAYYSDLIQYYLLVLAAVSDSAESALHHLNQEASRV